MKSTEEILHQLIDIVSKNGVLLLNVMPKADGSIPADQQKTLQELGKWLKTNGKAIYATRAFKVHGEEPALFDEGRGMGDHTKQMEFTSDDIRYTRSKDNTNYLCHINGAGKKGTKISIKIDNRQYES